MANDIKRRLHETILITGGAEETPRITISKFNCPGSLNHGEKTMLIEQDGKRIQLSLQSIETIVAWARTKN